MKDTENLLASKPMLCAVGQKVKMQPFIDSKDWVFGEVKNIDKEWIYIKWEDIDKILEHYHYEAKDFLPHCT